MRVGCKRAPDNQKGVIRFLTYSNLAKIRRKFGDIRAELQDIRTLGETPDWFIAGIFGTENQVASLF